ILPLLVAFYDRVGADPLLAPYFAPLDMAAHLPRIADFWSALLFHTARYRGNAFRPHLDMPGLDAERFARWLDALETTVDERYAASQRPAARLSATPNASPAAASRAAPDTTRHRTCRRLSPSAMRMPISRVWRLTA